LSYLRRENEIISAELSIAKKDCERLRVQAEMFRQQADAVRAQLDEEKANRDRLVQTQNEYNDHLQRLEQFNTLRESNACLRSDVRHMFSMLIALCSLMIPLIILTDFIVCSWRLRTELLMKSDRRLPSWKLSFSRCSRRCKTW
jgi:hypothetical protein